MSDLYFLDFHEARREHRKRWTRALEEPCRVLANDEGFEVEFADDDGTHQVVLLHQGGTFLGRCDCELMQREPTSGPCVHLCRVRMLAIIDHVTIPEKQNHREEGPQREVAQ